MLLKSSVLLCLLAAASGLWMCYPDEDLGCLSNDPPFSGGPQRPFTYIPNNPLVTYFLYTQKNIHHPQEISPSNTSSITSSCFDPKKKTYIIIHCFTESAQDPLLLQLGKAILAKEDVNVMFVDWSSASMGAYLQVVQTARVISKKINQMIRRIETLFQYPSEKICLIGNSVGAHIAGLVGKEHKNIYRIIALDPVSVGYEGVDEKARLFKSDAKFVFVFHTNAMPFSQMGLGYTQDLGHMDVFVNGGKIMPECPTTLPDLTPDKAICILSAITGPLGCPNIYPTPEQCKSITGSMIFTPKLIQSMMKTAFCSHYQATRYYIHSITNPEKFCAIPCKTVDKCQMGDTEPFPAGGCTPVGHYAQPPASGSQMYYLKTSLQSVSPVWNKTDTPESN